MEQFMMVEIKIDIMKEDDAENWCYNAIERIGNRIGQNT